MHKKSDEGQILLIVVLTMIVALTVGLSIAARVVTELKLSKQNEESQRAFQAAESGIQQTLERGISLSTIKLENNAAFSTSFKNDDGSQDGTGNGTAIILNNGQEVDQAAGADVWLSNYATNPSLLFGSPMGGGAGSVGITMYWGSPNQTLCANSTGDSVAPAIEVVLLVGPSSNPSVAKSLYEPSACGNTRISSSGAIISGTTNGSGTWTLKNQDFKYKADLKFNGSDLKNGLVMKVIPIFNSSVVGFQSGTVFPAQGAIITSTGTSGDTVRKVVYYQSYPQLPLEVFPYSLLSQ